MTRKDPLSPFDWSNQEHVTIAMDAAMALKVHSGAATRRTWEDVRAAVSKQMPNVPAIPSAVDMRLQYMQRFAATAAFEHASEQVASELPAAELTPRESEESAPIPEPASSPSPLSQQLPSIMSSCGKRGRPKGTTKRAHFPTFILPPLPDTSDAMIVLLLLVSKHHADLTDRQEAWEQVHREFFTTALGAQCSQLTVNELHRQFLVCRAAVQRKWEHAIPDTSAPTAELLMYEMLQKEAYCSQPPGALMRVTADSSGSEDLFADYPWTCSADKEPVTIVEEAAVEAPTKRIKMDGSGGGMDEVSLLDKQLHALLQLFALQWEAEVSLKAMDLGSKQIATN